jgi:transposase
MAQHTPSYPPEFRAEAIEWACTSRKPQTVIARELGMSVATLQLWRKRADLDAGKRTDGLSSEEQEEWRRWRRESRILREERELLKKPPPSSRRSAQRPVSCYEFVERAPANHPVVRLCRVLGVSPVAMGRGANGACRRTPRPTRS